jgi:glycerol kinase
MVTTEKNAAGETAMRDAHIIVIDAGTTSTRAMLFDAAGACLGSAQRALTQHYPAPGEVEHDAEEIWQATLACTQEMVALGGGAAAITAIGITNQRETVIFWDRESGAALAPAIVWQDRRTAERCAALKAAGHEPMVTAKTGLLLDPYFSATKIGWAMEHWPQLRAAGDRLAIGTVDAWLLWKLSGTHATDASNASRTMLMAIDGDGGWDADLCALFGAPLAALPAIIDSCGALGVTPPDLFGAPIAITSMIGDQQGATIGQGCLLPGMTKATYGTGAFVLTCSGAVRPVSQHRLLSTILMQTGNKRTYALEGSVFVAGSLIQWLRDGMGIIAESAETAALAGSVEDNGGVVIVPALAGLGAPWWRAEARGSITGLSFNSGRAHIARAALEAQSHQTADLKQAFAADGADWTMLRIDGGMSANDWLAQDLADILALPVERPNFVETTALGAAILAAAGAGLYPDVATAATAMQGGGQRFAPDMAIATRDGRAAAWAKAVTAVLG